MKSLAQLISSGLLIGFLPKAPGTWGSISAWVLLAPIAVYGNFWLSFFLMLAVFCFGWLAVSNLEVKDQQSDPKWVVVDEWAGVAVSLLSSAQAGWLCAFVALIFFRLFDIWKPGMVAKAEKLDSATGIMVDDIVAGFYAAMVVLIFRVFLNYV